MQPIATGLYAGPNGELHLDLPALLERYGYEDNEANRAAMMAAIGDIATGHGIQVTDVSLVYDL